MKILGILVLAVILVMPTLAKADISLSVSASVSSGTSLGSHIMLKCDGATYSSSGNPFDQCTNQGTTTSLAFGTLTTRLYNASGTDIGGADCFYGRYFFIVYLYPDAWGGKGYELKQNTGTFSSAIQNSVVRTPVYSNADKFLWPDGTYHAQGDLTSEEETWNPQLTPSVSVLAKDAGLILKSKRGRIVRTEYGIPPKPGTGQTRPTNWSAIPVTTAAASYSGSVAITITEWQ